MKEAHLYRMYTPEHICPFGTKSKYLLERQGFKVIDHLLLDHQSTEEFKNKEHVKTTPQTFISGQRIGGYDDLRTYFGKSPVQPNLKKTYKPVVALFGTTFTMSLVLGPGFNSFGALSMCALALLKLRDVFSFSNMFLSYDLLSRKWMPYSYIYPFVEATAGVLMLGKIMPWISGPLALFIGTEGAISVFKAVYIDKRDLKCACMGGGSNVPLGFVSLAENLLMIAMGIMAIMPYL